MNKKIFKHWHLILLFLIFFLALFLRLYKLREMPVSLNWDEVSHGYNAYSLLETGRDEWGQSWPLTNFRAYGDYPLPADLYLIMPSIALLGLNEFSIRLPHALLGSLMIFVCFFLARGLKLKKETSLLACFLVAISPWTLFSSRFVLQSNLSLFFASLGVAFFLNREKRNLFLPLSILFLGLSVYSYHNTRIFVPLLLLGLVFIFRKEWRTWWSKKRVSFIFAILLAIMFFAPLPAILLSQESRARASWVSIIDQGAINQIIENRVSSSLPDFLSRAFYNRPIYFLTHFAINYINYFSPNFLFFKGGTNYQFSIPGKGILFAEGLPFFYLGLALFVISSLKGKKQFQVVVLWALLSIVPAALTRGDAHVLRSSGILPLPYIFVSFGLFQTIEVISRKKENLKRIIVSLFLVLSLVSLFFYLKDYFDAYKRNYSWSWQYGYKQIVNYIKSHYSDYQKFYITKKYGEPHEFVLFFTAWDPQEYRDDPNLLRYFRSDWYWVDSFDKFVFVNDWEVKERVADVGENALLITSPDNYPQGWSIMEEVDFLDNSPAFEILKKD